MYIGNWQVGAVLGQNHCFVVHIGFKKIGKMGYSRTGETGERPSKIRLMLIVVAAIVLFILGFLIGFFAVRNDSESETRRSIEEIRKDDMEKKSKYHTKLYKGLDKTEIGKNLKYVSLCRLIIYHAK